MQRSQIVAPDIFDALAEPDVLLPLVMANAMSPRLWRLGRKVARAADPLEAARRVVDTSFTHALPEDAAAVSGLLDLDAERRRLGADVVDRAIADIERGWDMRRERGVLGPDDRLQDMIAAGRYPAYIYANIDVINAAGANDMAVMAIAGASIIPAPTPIAARAPSSTARSPASPPATEAAVKTAIPQRNTALRPKRSATAAPGISRLVKATV